VGGCRGTCAPPISRLKDFLKFLRANLSPSHLDNVPANALTICFKKPLASISNRSIASLDSSSPPETPFEPPSGSKNLLNETRKSHAPRSGFGLLFSSAPGPTSANMPRILPIKHRPDFTVENPVFVDFASCTLSRMEKISNFFHLSNGNVFWEKAIQGLLD